MLSERDKYRNPPPPVGYVQTSEPRLVQKKAAYESDPMYILMQELLDAKVYDIPDITIYEELVFNPSSDDEITEVPFVPVPKVVDTVDITAENDEPNIDPPINIKKERVTPEPPVVAKDSVQTTASESETRKQQKKYKKKRWHSRRRRKTKYKNKSYSYSSDNDAPSESYVNDSDSKKRLVCYSSDISDGSRSPTRKKEDYVNERKSCSKSHHRKKKNYSSGSDSKKRPVWDSTDISDGSRSPTRKKKDYVNERKSRSKNHHRKKKNYSSGSDSKKRPVWDSTDISDGSRSPTRKKEDYVNERKSRSKSHHRKKNYSSGSDSHSRRYKKRRSSSRSRSQSRHRHKKESSSYSDDDKYKKTESHSYKRLHGKDERQFDFQKDDTDNNSYKDSRHITSSSSSIGHQVLREETLQNTNLESDFLYGDYYCKVCNVRSNNDHTYENHLKGKKHKKKVENQQKEAQRGAILTKLPHAEEKSSNEEQMTPQNPLLLQPTSKYPEPLAGYYRQELNDAISVIQKYLDNAEFPCPGLHKVKEIRGPNETVYYCGICDCNCSYNSIIQHLKGFKHQLHSLKYYRSELYEMWSFKPKYQIQDKVIAVLYQEEEKYGRGFVTVEKDVKATDTQNAETVCTDQNICSQPSTSYQPPDKNFLENYKSYSKPDPTKYGYYCKLCDSHSNSESMWTAHILGKRHLANLKKNPGLGPTKSRYIRAERDVQPILFEIIEKENEHRLPIVGLSQIREIRKPDIEGLLFNCFLCGACISSLEILNHIVSAKHREKYLSSIKDPEIESLKTMQCSESGKNSILEDICARVQAEEGMGTPDVFFAKR